MARIEQDVLIRARAGDKKARDFVVLSMIPGIRSDAWRIDRSELDDLIHIGVVSALLAVDHYEPGHSEDFVSYAKYWWRRDMRLYARQVRYPVTVSRHMLANKYSKLLEARRLAEQKDEDAGPDERQYVAIADR